MPLPTSSAISSVASGIAPPGGTADCTGPGAVNGTRRAGGTATHSYRGLSPPLLSRRSRSSPFRGRSCREPLADQPVVAEARTSLTFRASLRKAWDAILFYEQVEYDPPWLLTLAPRQKTPCRLVALKMIRNGRLASPRE